MYYKDLFYFDIETTGKYKDYQTCLLEDPKGAELFEKKYHKNDWMKENSPTVDDAYKNFAGLFSTYGKIVCVSFGYFTKKNENGYTVNSIYGDDEEKIINEFSELLSKVSKKGMYLSGYVINAFDIPFVVHKILKYKAPLPSILNLYDKKPWEVSIFDLADKWKYQTKYYASLDEVCYELGIESPKNDINGSEVHKVYWYNNDLERIKMYCEKDVLSTMKVGKRLLDL